MMAEQLSTIDIPQDQKGLIRLAQGYPHLTATEASLPPYPSTVQDWLSIPSELTPNSLMCRRLPTAPIYQTLPEALQTEDYARNSFDYLTGDSLDRAVAVRLGYGQQLLQSDASLEYLVHLDALRPSPVIKPSLLRAALGNILNIVEARPHVSLRFFGPTKHVAGLTLLYTLGDPHYIRKSLFLDGIDDFPVHRATNQLWPQVEEEYRIVQSKAFSHDWSMGKIKRTYDSLGKTAVY